jgi:hypothetical protein
VGDDRGRGGGRPQVGRRDVRVANLVLRLLIVSLEVSLH